MLNAIGLIFGFIGATIFWSVGKTESSGLPFYADSQGTILAEIKAKGKKRDSFKNFGMVLIAVSFLCQFIALLL
ncbi:MAG: hypothetical protein HOP20_06145 [Sulfuriferula sp.]|nr:hypothetical protein [Sulfuriferula sp.]